MRRPTTALPKHPCQVTRVPPLALTSLLLLPLLQPLPHQSKVLFAEGLRPLRHEEPLLHVHDAAVHEVREAQRQPRHLPPTGLVQQGRRRLHVEPGGADNVVADAPRVPQPGQRLGRERGEVGILAGWVGGVAGAGRGNVLGACDAGAGRQKQRQCLGRRKTSGESESHDTREHMRGQHPARLTFLSKPGGLWKVMKGVL